MDLPNQELVSEIITPKKQNKKLLWIFVVVLLCVLLGIVGLYSKFLASNVSKSIQGNKMTTVLSGTLDLHNIVYYGNGPFKPGQHVLKFKGKTVSGQTVQASVNLIVNDAPNPYGVTSCISNPYGVTPTNCPPNPYAP